jgi:hypothetical protein
MRLDRKELLDEIEFVWESQSPNLDKQWNLQYEKLVDWKRKNGHCMVPRSRYEQDKPLGQWVGWQGTKHANDKMRLDRKELLDKLGFVWRAEAGDDDTNWL